jgi:hypothetical protein
MAEQLHPAAPHNIPSFITAPAETDVLMVAVGVFVALAVVGFGVLYLRLHALPERIAHKRHKLQFEIVAVLGLVALFTHMHIFWIVGLLLALIDLPDFGTPLNRIAGSAEKIAGMNTEKGAVEKEPKAALRQVDDGVVTPTTGDMLCPEGSNRADGRESSQKRARRELSNV